jgi:hypothetical protein
VGQERLGPARTILLFHIISDRPSKQPRMVGSTLGVYSFALIFVSARTNKRHHHHPLKGCIPPNEVVRSPPDSAMQPSECRVALESWGGRAASCEVASSRSCSTCRRRTGRERKNRKRAARSDEVWWSGTSEVRCCLLAWR